MTCFSVSLDDYELLEKLNQLTKQKYVEMDNVAKGLITRMEQINEKCECRKSMSLVQDLMSSLMKKAFPGCMVPSFCPPY